MTSVLVLVEIASAASISCSMRRASRPPRTLLVDALRVTDSSELISLILRSMPSSRAPSGVFAVDCCQAAARSRWVAPPAAVRPGGGKGPGASLPPGGGPAGALAESPRVPPPFLPESRGLGPLSRPFGDSGPSPGSGRFRVRWRSAEAYRTSTGPGGGSGAVRLERLAEPEHPVAPVCRKPVQESARGCPAPGGSPYGGLLDRLAGPPWGGVADACPGGPL